MNVELAQELVNQLSSSLENFETQHASLLQFLKDRGVVSEEQLAPYLAQAARASGVRWRAARIRLDSLIEAEKSREEAAAENEKQRKRDGRAPDENQSKPREEKDTQPRTEDTAGKPADKEQEEDAKIAEQAYSSIPS